jgi:uncharacterized protein YdhG (YjbR/CyaY superfamily)
MKIAANSVEEYLKALPQDRLDAVTKIRAAILKKLPKGFEECLNYGMIGYVVPHSIYPKGYHCDPKQPLPFMNIASQKNFISLYHMGLYINPDLLTWFVAEYPKHSAAKLDMGKGCVRFKKLDQIPYKLIEELTAKIKVKEFIAAMETLAKK